jgi:hypothetical protein
VRADGQKMLLAIKSMGGEAPRLSASCPRRPEFLIVDGAPGLDKAIAAV